MSMNIRLSRKGWLGVGIVLIMLTVLLTMATVPFLWRQSVQEQLSVHSASLEQIESRLKSSSNQNHAITLTEQGAAQVFVAGETHGLANANLQRLVAELATANGLKLENVQSSPSEQNGSLARLRLAATAHGGIQSLRNYLLAIEAGTPLLFVTGATIEVPAKADDAASAFPSDNLAISVEIEAFTWRASQP